MGSWKITENERNINLFNSPTEIGLRTLFLLSAFTNVPLSIDKLIYFDYFLLHAKDIDKKRKSLHPKYPYRSSEIIVKRDILNRALRLLISKELIRIIFSANGLSYTVTEIGRRALEYFESQYSKDIRITCEWIFEDYKDYTEQQLSDIINTNLKKWGGEFHSEVKFRNF